MTDRDQLDGFAASLARETKTPLQTPANWLDAFYWLDQCIDDSKRTVVVLDEISWMGGYNPLFQASCARPGNGISTDMTDSFS